MSNRLLPILVIALLPFALEAKQAEFPQTRSMESIQLEKVGQGTFRWMFFKVYEGALYLDAENTGAEVLSDVAKCLELRYNVSISARQFQESGDSILRRNTDDATWQAIQEPLKKLNAAYRDVENGDRYALQYVPGTGTTLILNGDPLVTVGGAEFARAYFSIWLGEDAVKASFRNALLGNR